MSDCPCNGCTFETGRSYDCHGSCKRYKDWRKVHEKRAADDKIRRGLLHTSRTGQWVQKPNGYWKNTNMKGRK